MITFNRWVRFVDAIRITIAGCQIISITEKESSNKVLSGDKASMLALLGF